MTIWFDIEDLIKFFQFASRPTGIQRLSFEIYRAAWAQAGETGAVRFCRRGSARNSCRAIHFPALEAGIIAASHSAARAAEPAAIPEPPRRTTGRLQRFAQRLPPRYRRPLGRMYRAARQMYGAAHELTVTSVTPTPPTNRVGGHQFELDGPDVTFEPGDWFVNLGAPWSSPYDAAFLDMLADSGVRLAMLAHDMIPRLYPEWCPKSGIDDFNEWLNNVVPRAARMFAVSRSTANDLARCLAADGHVRSPAHILPVGSDPVRHADSPPLINEPYVLMVGTVEARKNHAAMLRVWRRLLSTMAADQVPVLVIAGKVGWLTNDLMEQFANADWLDDKIRFIDSPAEPTLVNLYEHCLFTVFPSFYEGWGLPVSESLAYGKPVAASKTSSIPEAGGDFCAYFDPDNINDIAATIQSLIEDKTRLATLAQRIASDYRPPTWHDTATALLSALGIDPPDPAYRMATAGAGAGK
jgi:glycosyltransferase involved in cell wall biosynthesis